MNKRKSILSDIEKNYADTKSISKTVDLTSLENGVNPHTIYKDVFKKVDNDTPNDFPTEKISVGDIVYINGNPSEQYEIISINNKNNIVIKNLSTNEVIDTNEKNIKKIMENIDMAKKKINETQYSVSINGLETTDANALSQMMSAAAQADSGNADVGGIDMTSTPELPTPITDVEATTSVESIPPAEDSVETFDEEPSFEDSDIEGMDDELPTDVENPLDNPEPEMDSFEDDFEPVVDDIDFDEEITPTEDELEMDIEEPVKNDLGINESQLNESRPDKEDFINSNTQNVDENVLQELYEIICEQMGDDYLSDYDEVDHMELLDCVKDFGNDIEGFDEEFAEEYANALQEKWKKEHIDDGSDYEDYGRPNWEDEEDEEINENYDDEEDEKVKQAIKLYKKHGMLFLDDEEGRDAFDTLYNAGYTMKKDRHLGHCIELNRLVPFESVNDEEDEEINEDILLPKATEDETFVAKKKLENDKEEDEESERISESMDALIKSILESADAKSEQEIYAEEISEADESNDMDNMVCLYDGSGSIEIEAPKDLVIEVGKSGDNSDAVNNLKNAVQDKISQYSDDELKSVLKDYAIDDYETMDREEIENYVLWILAWNYVDSDHDDLDSDIDECLKNAGVQLDEATVRPTIVTDESSFANKPNKALKPEDKKTVEKKTVDTATFGKDASEGFKEPLNCIKCEAVSPKEKIKAIYETAKTRYANADKSQWNALDRRYIRKLIESGCGYTRASKIILEAKKKK